MKDTTSTPRAACHSLSDTDDMCLKLKKPVTATTATTDTTAKNKDTLYYYSFDVTRNPKISSNCAQTGKESKPPTPKAQRGKRSKGPVEMVSYKELERAIIYSNMNHSLGFCHVIIM